MRSFLYVPSDQTDKLTKALVSEADAIICDLEDAVSMHRKIEARATLGEALSRHNFASAPRTPAIWVRINQGDLGIDDIAAVVRSGGAHLAGIYVPKVESLDRLNEIDRALSIAEMTAGLVDRSIAVCALLETPSAILDARILATGIRVVRLAIGEADLSASIGTELTPGDEREHLFARQLVVLASAAGGIEAPVGPVSTDFRDLAALRSSTEALRRLGFRGRAAIHPAQVAVINEVFTRSPEAVSQARRLVDMFDAATARGNGVCVDENGRMVDEAVVLSARRLLQTWAGKR